MNTSPSRVSVSTNRLLLALAGSTTSLLGVNAVAQQPNVIVIVADDAGYADWGFMDGVNGSNATASDIPTPNLDALAGRGVKFSRAYVAQSCAPTRAALVTGGYQNRIGNEVVGNNYYLASQGFAQQGYVEGVPSESVTIWERMQAQGYSTAAVGKWHLGQTEQTGSVLGNRPEHQGVDEFFGIWHGSRTYNIGGQGNHPTQVLRRTTVDAQGNVTDTNEEANYSGQYFTNAIGEYGADIISERYDDADPFFLYQSFTAPHTPLQNSPDFNDPRLAGLSGDRKTYASMMLTMDNEIGRMLDRLEDPNQDGNTSDSIADNTLVVFVNDNGGADAFSSSPNAADNGILRRGKGSPFEGGIRVPMIIAGAGVDPSVHGTTYANPVHGVDVLPTAFAAGGGSFGAADSGIDGVNLLPFINGQATETPHEVLVHRHRTQFAVIRDDDWKLVWSGNTPSANHQLYNLATDVSETTNLAGANPTIVAELQRELTNHEATFDKARFEILGNTSEATININDHFTFNPSNPMGGQVDVIEGDTGNGNFNAGGGGTAGGAQPYDATDHWHNAQGAETINFTQSSQMGGSSDSDNSTTTRGGMPFRDRVQVNDTGHTVTAAGETFSLSYDFGAGGPASRWTGVEMLRSFLFTSDGSVDGNITEGNITELGGDDYAIDRAGDGQWTTRTVTDFYTTTAADIGKTVYFGIEFLDGDNSDGDLFPRIDVVELSAVTLGSGGVSSSDWSDDGTWFEGGTSNVDTMFHSDSFAGAVLEFPTTDAFSYVSHNDMVRSTGLEFMMNKMILSGSFGGGSAQSATIEGNSVLFTRDLDGVAPEIAVDAINAGAAAYAYAIDLDLVLFDDLTFSGNGDVEVVVNGQIRDYFESRGIHKQGTSVVALAGTNTYTGATTIQQGTLALVGNGTLANTSGVQVAAGATFDVSGRNGGGWTLGNGQTLSGSGNVVGHVTAANGSTVGPGTSPGELTIQGNYTHQIGASLHIELDAGGLAGVDHDRLVITGTANIQGGTLIVELADGFVPAANATFEIATFAAGSGTFDAVDFINVPSGLTFEVNYLPTLIELEVLSLLRADFNGDGMVGLLDLDILGANWQQSGTSTTGDANGDGVVSLLDLDILGSEWGSTTSFEAALAQRGLSIPEPASAMLLLASGSMLVARRR